MDKYTWEHSKNEEFWNHDLFDTIEECLQDAKENYDVKIGDTIAIGKVVPYEARVFAGHVLEQLESDAYEECGECAEDWETFSYKDDREKLDELSNQLTEVVKAWLKKYKREPDFYKIENVRTIEVK